MICLGYGERGTGPELTRAAAYRIYSLETQANQKHEHPDDPESSPLLNGDAENPDKAFTNTLDAELEKVTSFYQLKEREIYDELNAMLRDEDNYDEETDGFEQDQAHMPPDQRVRKSSIFRQVGFTRPRAMSGVSGQSTADGTHQDDDDDSDEEADETSRLRRKSPDGRIRRQHTNEHMAASTDYSASRRRTSVAFEDYNDMAFSALYDEGVSLKKRAVSVYVSLCELRSFIQLNKTGFEKVLKKYDKILDRKLKSHYLNKYVYPAHPFQQSTMDQLTENLNRIEDAYAHLCTKGDVAEAKRELRLHLREHVVWERNTVWREMIGIERKAQAANIGITQTLLGRDTSGGKVRRQGDDIEPDLKEVSTPIGKYRCPQWLISKTFWLLVACIAIFVVLLVVPIMEKPEQQNCLAMVIFVSLLWATEVLSPYFLNIPDANTPRPFPSS
jgi:phosphate transporter